MAYTVRGFGAMDYGKRDFRGDGSYVTTLWFVAFYIPVIPIHSKRLRLSGEVKYYGLHRRPVIQVLEKTRPNRTQVLSVYGWFAAELMFAITAQVQQIWWIALPGVMLLPLPWVLRRRAVERVKLGSEREAIGFSPTLPG